MGIQHVRPSQRDLSPHSELLKSGVTLVMFPSATAVIHLRTLFPESPQDIQRSEPRPPPPRSLRELSSRRCSACCCFGLWITLSNLACAEPAGNLKHLERKPNLKPGWERLMRQVEEMHSSTSVMIEKCLILCRGYEGDLYTASWRVHKQQETQSPVTNQDKSVDSFV